MSPRLLRRLPLLLFAALALVALATGGCSGKAASAPASLAPDVRFTDVTAAAGFAHRHHKPILDAKLDNIMSWMASVGATAAAGDFDNDGWIDLYVTNAHKGEPNYLYRNNGDGTFTDVAEKAGLRHANDERGTSMDAIWGDVDNDGWDDLYLVRWGNDSLYRNHGDGTFSDVTEKLFRRRDGSPGMPWANGNAAVFLDYDGDGRLDIYVGNYFQEIDLWNLADTRIMHDDFERSRNAGPNFLFRQEADGTFTEVAAELGVDDVGWTLAVGAGDLDNNGWPDLYCANDFGPDQLFLNYGDGTFENVTDKALGQDTKKGMNADFGDFNNDGWLDVYVTNITTAEYLQEGNMLWHNNGLGPDGELTLTDIALEAGTYDGGWGWGAKFWDYDNDGDLDLVAGNGFISAGEGSYWYDLASWTVLDQDAADAANWPAIGDRSFSGFEKIRLWRNDGLFSFTEQAANAGLTTDRDERGIAVVDYDNDGDLDLYLANQDQPPNLYRNEGTPRQHWLQVALIADPATGVNRNAIGTRVTAVTARGPQIRERDGGNGYSGQSDPRLHFGLGDATRVELLEVRWPDGGLQYLENVAADQRLEIRQDPSAYGGKAEIAFASKPLPVAPATPAAPAAPQLSPGELDRNLGELEGRLAAGGKLDHAMAHAYRKLAASHGAHDRAIAFFQKQIEARPSPALRIELSAAYVDKIPACGGLAAVVCKGTVAKKGLDQLDLVIAEHPDAWLAHYARGTNHLNWPRALHHSADAARDFERAVEIQEQGPSRPYHLRIWIALGNAYVKDGRAEEGRAAWRRGLERFPGAPELEKRLAVSDDDQLLQQVLDEYNLQQAIDTDLSFFDGEL